jgi:hypothetical protein
MLKKQEMLEEQGKSLVEEEEMGYGKFWLKSVTRISFD